MHFRHDNFVNFNVMKPYPSQEFFTLKFVVAAFFFFIHLTPVVTVAQDKRVDVNALYQKAEAAHNAGNYSLALEYLNRCLKESPGYADAYFTRGSTREQLRDLAGANTDYNIYLELKPDQPEALFSRAAVRYRLGLYEQAKTDFLKVLDLPAGETQTIYFNRSARTTGKNQVVTIQGNLRSQIMNYLGLVETKLGNYTQALVWLDSAIKLDPEQADYFVNRGIAKEAMNDTTAEQDYRTALTLQSEHPVALHNIAVLSRKRGDTSSLENELERAIESDSSMLYPYLERAFQRMEGGYYKGALDDYNRALKIQDRDPEIWLNRGHVYEKLNELKNAYSDYTKAISLDEKYEKAWLNRGNVLSKQGRLEDAIEDYTVAITFNSSYAAAYYNRAIARQRLKKYDEACADLKKAATLGLAIPDKMTKEICR